MSSINPQTSQKSSGNGNGHLPAQASLNGHREDASLQNHTVTAPKDGGKLIVITAPLTETIDHAGYFIQMSMASLPIWLEGILNRKYPAWRNLEYQPDGSARYMPAGIRVLGAALLRHYTS